MDESAIKRAVNALQGARVVGATIESDGRLWIDLEHRGTDEGSCSLVVDPDKIFFADTQEHETK